MIGPLTRTDALERARASATLALRAARRCRLTIPLMGTAAAADAAQLRAALLDDAADALRWWADIVPPPTPIQIAAGPHPRRVVYLPHPGEARRPEAAALAAALRAERAASPWSP